MISSRTIKLSAFSTAICYCFSNVCTLNSQLKVACVTNSHISSQSPMFDFSYPKSLYINITNYLHGICSLGFCGYRVIVFPVYGFFMHLIFSFLITEYLLKSYFSKLYLLNFNYKLVSLNVK